LNKLIALHFSNDCYLLVSIIFFILTKVKNPGPAEYKWTSYHYYYVIKWGCVITKHWEQLLLVTILKLTSRFTRCGHCYIYLSQHNKLNHQYSNKHNLKAKARC